MFRAVVLLVVGASGVCAQTFTESARAAVGVQVEAGAAVETNGEQVDLSGPEGLLLWGVRPGLELRFGLPDYVAADIRGDRTGGVADAAVGVKAEIATAAGWAFGVLAEVSVPLSDGGAVSPLLLLLAEREVGSVTVGVQAEGLWDRALSRLDVGGVVLGQIPLGGLFAAFGEVAANQTAAGPVLALHNGYLWQVLPALQLDVRVGTGLTDAAPTVFGGVGLRAAL